MEIKFLLLGYLNWKPQTPIGLRQIITESEFLDVTQNGNQLYHALIQLLEKEWVVKTESDDINSSVQPTYTITQQGKKALNNWLTSPPDLHSSKESYFFRLLWAENLNLEDLEGLLTQYYQALQEKLFILRVQADEKPNTPNRSEREIYLWEMIQKNGIVHYELELNWVRQMQDDLKLLEAKRQRALRRQKRAASN